MVIPHFRGLSYHSCYSACGPEAAVFASDMPFRGVTTAFGVAAMAISMDEMAFSASERPFCQAATAVCGSVSTFFTPVSAFFGACHD
jgi:hypothetical protein